MKIKNLILEYKPFSEQEVIDKEYYLNFISSFEDVLTRDNQVGHFTASAFVVNKDFTKTLVVYHNILNGYIYPGGHADGEENLLEVAVREVEEETGVKATVLSKEPFAINSAPTLTHVKKGKVVPSHIHFDVVYLLQSDENISLKIKADENQDVKWVSLESLENIKLVDFMIPIFKKLKKKLEIVNKQKEKNILSRWEVEICSFFP